ncbi:hypothetical protein [Fructilactobacillus florum]|nr:hypothetical protein [Fructilactobacillus florum]
MIIELGEKGAHFNNISFNRYYSEGEDTDERAETAMQNLIVQLKDFKQNL